MTSVTIHLGINATTSTSTQGNRGGGCCCAKTWARYINGVTFEGLYLFATLEFNNAGCLLISEVKYLLEHRDEAKAPPDTP